MPCKACLASRERRKAALERKRAREAAKKQERIQRAAEAQAKNSKIRYIGADENGEGKEGSKPCS